MKATIPALAPVRGAAGSARNGHGNGQQNNKLDEERLY